jgi:hypothetical protein
MQDSRLVIKLKDSAREAQVVAHEIERGQAHTPLGDHCQRIVDDYTHRAPAVVLLATSDRARNGALRWLLGPSPTGAVLRAGAGDGLTDIALEGEGYALLLPQGRRQDLADLNGFLAAIDLAPQAPLRDRPDPQREAVAPAAAPPVAPWQPMSLLVPDSINVALEQAGLLGDLHSRAQLFVIAHDEQSRPLAADQWDKLHQCLPGSAVLWPVEVGLPAGAIAGRWWRELQPLAPTTLAPVAVDAEATASPLQGAVGECLRPWALQAAAQRLRQAVAALKERLDHDTAQLQARRAREEDEGRPEPATDALQRRPFDVARLSLVDGIGVLAKLPAETARRSLLPEGALSMAIGEQLRRLEHADLEREPGAKMVKLTLASVAQGQLVTALRRCLKDEVASDVANLAQGLQALRQKLEPTLEAAAGQPVRLNLAAPDSAALWSDISDMVAVDVRYRGEMPRRGFFQRLGEGRKAVFAGLMVLSLLGTFAGFSWRGVGLLGVAFLVVFIGVVVLTYRTWQQEDAERLDKELERVREQLLTECRRVAGDVQREKMARLAGHADQLKRQLQLQIDDLQRDRQARDQAQLAEQRERSRRRKEQLDRQLRETQNLAGRLGKVVLEVQRLHDDAAAEARDMAVRRKLLA